MTAFLDATWALRYPLMFIVGICLGVLIVLAREAGRERRVRDDFLLASLRASEPPIRDELAAEWLAAELDDPAAVQAWLGGGAA